MGLFNRAVSRSERQTILVSNWGNDVVVEEDTGEDAPSLAEVDDEVAWNSMFE